MTTPTPASPIPQKTAKWLVYSREHNLWWRAERCGYTVDRAKAGRYTQEEAESICKTVSRRVLDDIDEGPSEFAVLDIDPSDAAELERLRKVEDEAAKHILQFLSADTIPPNDAVTSWRNHFYARIVFEAKIGGGK